MRAAVVGKLAAARTEAIGVDALPDGGAYYVARLRQQTSVSIDPEALRQSGLAEVDRLGALLDARLRTLGQTEGSVGERLERLREQSRYGVEDTDAGRARLGETAQELLARARTASKPYFTRFPESDVIIRLTPDFARDSSPSSYMPPAADGSRPGVFNFSIRDAATVSKMDLPRLIVHETIPGHHYQLALQQESALPILRQYLPFSGYSEGWATYAETLAVDMGLYGDTPVGEIGALRSHLSLAVLQVVETGLHHKGWSREQAIAYVADTLATPREQIESAIDRMLVWPGQMITYIVGSAKIEEMRAKTKNQLGDRFDIKAFHDEILREGAMPLDVLDRRIDAWIARGRTPSAP